MTVALALFGIPLTYMISFQPGMGYYLWTLCGVTFLLASIIEGLVELFAPRASGVGVKE
jgi:hypothetical protein